MKRILFIVKLGATLGSCKRTCSHRRFTGQR